MWRGYEQQLAYYGYLVCMEWLGRGYKDTCWQKISAFIDGSERVFPPWLTSEFASNHRSILLGKAWEARIGINIEITTTEVISLSRARKLARKYDKAKEVVKWYTQWNWTEKPATRNEDGRWPYQWNLTQ